MSIPNLSFQNYRPPEKSNLSYLKCVALVKPTSENIRLLAREVASPRYGSYFIFFTNRVKRADLKSLAEADGNEVVSDLKEIPSDFLVFESHVFTTKLPTEMPFPVKNLQWNKENSALQRYVWASFKLQIFSMHSFLYLFSANTDNCQ